jgi:integrase
MKWKDLSIEKIDGEERLLIYVDGKTGPRELVARSCCITYFKRIHKRTDAIKNIPFSEVLNSKIDLPIFVLSNGIKTDNLRQTFRSLLKEANLLLGKNGKNRTLYSLRHTYATFNLINNRGSDIHLLARQMGTSTLMIEKHYSHLIARMRSRDLSGYHYNVFTNLDD